MTLQLPIIFIVLFFRLSYCSFWNEIPQRCIYDRTSLFSCWNTTFTRPIPLFNELKYTLENHYVQILYTDFQLPLTDLFSSVAPNIEQLTLINNTLSSSVVYNQSTKIYFRLLQTLTVSDSKGWQWLQLNSSYYPQLIRLDLSFNQFTNQTQLIFNRKNFHVLRSLNLSYNQLDSIENLTGDILQKLESLILSHNPLKIIRNKIHEFQSLVFLDLSATSIKQLFDLKFFPRLEVLVCRSCQKISMDDYNQFLTNCSDINHQLTLDLSQTSITSVKIFNSCIKNLILNDQNSLDSISTNDFRSNTNLETIQIRKIDNLNSIHLNVYDRLRSVDFSENLGLKQVQLHLLSDYTYLQRLNISQTSMNEFSIDFNQTTLKYLHIDLIDLSFNQLETLDFLKYLTFYSLDVSFNRLKIINIDRIQFRHGMYDLSLMNSLNLSSNQIETIEIHWMNESPHTIDLSQNNLQSIKLHGQSTYTLLLNNNRNLSVTPFTCDIDLPTIQYLDLSSIYFPSFENLVYLHNLSDIHTLILNNNQLEKKHRTLNWNVFYPWHKNLTHVSLRSMSIENIDSGVDLRDYYHLLTINFYDNDQIKCDCGLQPFIQWLKTPPPPLAEFYEPLKKAFFSDCPISLMYMSCDDRKSSSIVFYILLNITLILIIVAVIITLVCYMKCKQPKSYRAMSVDMDSMILNETDMFEKIDVAYETAHD
ncbi:unnamed protein product [Adineta ricciae]|uniref:Uncharacterized protein n=1 Tax=Adineta ricciae TaxID=249248 RepID=A0A815WPM5_ADIRI|nr:unnamed protein product [Adineta ricciae]